MYLAMMLFFLPVFQKLLDFSAVLVHRCGAIVLMLHIYIRVVARLQVSKLK